MARILGAQHDHGLVQRGQAPVQLVTTQLHSPIPKGDVAEFCPIQRLAQSPQRSVTLILSK